MMSEETKKEDIEKPLEDEDKWNGDSTLILLLFLLFSFGFGSNDNSRINDLEKKVAILEGQMSMIGGKVL